MNWSDRVLLGKYWYDIYRPRALANLSNNWTFWQSSFESTMKITERVNQWKISILAKIFYKCIIFFLCHSQYDIINVVFSLKQNCRRFKYWELCFSYFIMSDQASLLSYYDRPSYARQAPPMTSAQAGGPWPLSQIKYCPPGDNGAWEM